MNPNKSMSQAAFPRVPSRGVSHVVVAVGAALALGIVLDFALISWIRAGPPAGKGELFFLELVVMIAAALVVSATAVIAPETARRVTPFLFVALAWHTGFQVSLDPSGQFVISVFDVLVPLCLFLGLLGRWYLTGSEAKSWFQEHWRLMAVFWAFSLWGLIVAISRDVDPAPMLANFKSLLFYPLIVVVLPWCIRSWKQLYWVIGLMAALIFERTLDGLYQAATREVSKFVTELAHGNLIYRIDGHMAATNQYAAYLVTGGLVLLGLLAASRLRPAVRFALIVPMALMGLALLLTYSRGAWLGMAVGLIALLLILRPGRAAFALAAVVVVAFVVEVVHPGAGSQILLRANDFDHSIAVRENYQSLGFQVVQRFPLGAGWGAWFQRTPGGVQPISGFPWYHDDYLQMATEIGIPGLLSMLAILGSLVSLGWRTSRRVIDPTKMAVVAGLTAAFIALLVQTATDQFLWHADIAPHIWIVAGLLVSSVVLVRADAWKKATIDAALRQADEVDERLPVGYR